MAQIEMKSEFYDVADEFINLANKLREKHSTTRISAVMMFAASRYNAFNFFITDSVPENEEKAIDYYCKQYRLMLKDNFERLRDEFNNKE